MTSPNYSSCMKNCSMLNGISSQYSPKCTIIKRCTSPKPPPVPGCKWVKRCTSNVDIDNMSDDDISINGVISPFPMYRHRRRYIGSPFMYRRHHFGRHPFGRISPFATTAIGHGNHHMRGRWGRGMGSPMHRGMGSPIRRGLGSVGRRF